MTSPPSPSRIAILGSTGSIGRQALEVVRAHPDRFEVVALAVGSDRDAVLAQARDFDVEVVGVGEADAVGLARWERADVVLNAIVGAAGLRSSVAALESGKILALANKESLVAGGEICARAAAEGGGAIVPIDSEHAALAQALSGVGRAEVRRIIITASGGPFRTRADLSQVTPQEALAHPTWSMGPKITVDSATLMNKGLEVIEAHHLFDLDYDHIDVVVHPQSVVHGIVELVDGTMLMQAAPTDMRIPIQAALAHPDRLAADWGSFDPAGLGSLSFEPVDRPRFPALDLAYDAGHRGGSFPAVLNAANEVAVHAFLQGRLSFPSVWEVAGAVLAAHGGAPVGDVDVVMQVDAWARSEALRSIDTSGVTV
jgi:1-deoxy-D-xylulose-5-phosphate reductoisomerase